MTITAANKKYTSFTAVSVLFTMKKFPKNHSKMSANNNNNHFFEYSAETNKNSPGNSPQDYIRLPDRAPATYPDQP
ncbi:hypothetical protein [Paenibacillus contaminans]|nr:hypothetical protein [Paenibacillus contaminans]